LDGASFQFSAKQGRFHFRLLIVLSKRGTISESTSSPSAMVRLADLQGPCHGGRSDGFLITDKLFKGIKNVVGCDRSRSVGSSATRIRIVCGARDGNTLLLAAEIKAAIYLRSQAQRVEEAAWRSFDSRGLKLPERSMKCNISMMLSGQKLE
jgi:hypothetical protein